MLILFGCKDEILFCQFMTEGNEFHHEGKSILNLYHFVLQAIYIQIRNRRISRRTDFKPLSCVMKTF